MAEGAQRDVDEARPQLPPAPRARGRDCRACPAGSPARTRRPRGPARAGSRGPSARADRAGPTACRGRCRIPGSRDSAGARAVIFKTSAPCSARVRAQVGPARTRVRSSTRMPDSGRSPSGSFSGGLSPILTISISGSEAIAAACGCCAHSAMRAHHAAGALGGDDRLLELERVPLRHRLAHRLAVFRHAEHAQRGGAVVREVGSGGSSSGRSWPDRRP